MKVTGIICEFNPFHQGHKYLMEEARSQTGSSFLVCIMSGDFVQRGEPAAIDKYQRTRMALEGGADLVFELPTRFALSSAGDFARGGLLALEALPFVTDLFFGSESGDIGELMNLAQAIHRGGKSLDLETRRLQETGLSYAAARQKALSSLDSAGLLSEPNNTLGIEYCLAVLESDADLRLHTLLRRGQAYNNASPQDFYPSASSLRASMAARRDKMLTANDFSQVLSSLLLREQDLTLYKDISPDLANRLKNQAHNFQSLDQFVDLCQTRVYTASRIRRCLFQMLLGLKDRDMTLPYLRLLGMKKTASHLLREITDCSILNSLAVDQNLLDSHGQSLLQKDLLASHLYRLIWQQKYGETRKNEFQHRPIIL
ncbi:MAG: nucleotidyltransferase family protein [Eubacterium sp.]|nr:nucleotidyltransferase family protein [Eubacterium sp.]